MSKKQWSKKQWSTKLLIGLLAVSSVLLAPLSLAGETKTDAIIKSPNDQRSYRAITLPNQLKVLMVSDPESEKSAASLSVDVGLLFDPMTQQGMAHYLEHMLFMGTEKYPDTAEYSEFITANGGSSNAYTWMDVTNYMFNIKNNAFDEALDRFSDFFKTPKLYPEYIEKEKSAVNAEWSMRRELDYFGQFKLKRQLMGSHPANRFLIGNLETLSDKEDSKLHPETVAFYNRYYSANIMNVALLSNLDLDEMEKLARKHFSAIENKKIKDPEVTAPMPAFGGKRLFYQPNEEVKQIILDFTIKNNQDQFQFKPNYFVNYLIGSEMPGTPAFLLKEMGLISSLSGQSVPNTYGNYGDFKINISLTDKGMQQRELIVATVMRYLNMIREKGVDEKYFKEIQTSLDNRFRFLEKTNEFSYVADLAQNMLDYPVRHVISAPYHYERFNPKAIQNTLSQLTVDNLLVWYVSKEETVDQKMHFYAGEYRIEPISEAEVSSWEDEGKLAMSLPAVNRLLPENFELFTEASESGETPELAYDHKGVQIWNFPSQYFAHQPRGLIRLLINNPDSQKDPAAEVMLNLWANLYNLQQSALATEASIAGMRLALSADNGLTLSISGFTDKQDILLKQAFDKLLVDVSEENFKQAVDRYVRAIKNSQKQFAISQVITTFSEVLRTGTFENDTLIKTAESLSHKDLKRFMKHILDNNQIRTFAYGNYNKSDIAELADQIEQMLPDDRRVTDYAKTAYLKPIAGQTLVYRSDIPVEDVAIMDMYVHPEPGFATKAAAGILRSHYRAAAFDTLRTEEQLAYAVSGLQRNIDDYVAFGLVIQTPVMDVTTMQKRFDRFNADYAKKVEAMTEEEFNTLKASRLTTLNEKPKNISEEVSPLISDWTREQFDFDSRQKLIAATEKVSLGDLKAFFNASIGNPEAARINVQLRGNKFTDKPYYHFENEKVIDDLSVFHATADHQ